jgi:fido (protein-threonine AMPylation protein)
MLTEPMIRNSSPARSSGSFENYLRGLDPDRFAARLAYFYSELDSTHPFPEGNSRTLRQFTADLALAAGYELDWEPTGLTEDTRNALYVARDRAFPTPTIRSAHSDHTGEFDASPAIAILPGKRHI